MEYPKFIDEIKFLKLHKDLSEIDLLKQFSSNLKQIHKLTTSHYTNFDTLIMDYLKAGLSIFSMDIGIVSEILESDYIICNALSPDNSLSKGDKFELAGTYCREVIHTGKIIGFPHVGAIEQMKNHPVYQNMKLESYISAPIFKNDIIFGTLNFSSTKIREHGFSEYEKELIGMMASSIGSFLLLKDKEARLENSNKRIRTLTGYVAHDLRSPLGTISALVDLIKESEDEEKDELLNQIKVISNKSLELAHTILEAAILGKGKLNIEKECHYLDEIILDSLEDYSEKFKESGLVVNSKLIASKIFVDKERLLQVFSNIFSNMIKYAVPGSTVKIEIIDQKNKYRVIFENEINEKKVIEGYGKNVSETGSIGFGLEIIREVLKLHESELSIDSKDNVYKSYFDIKKLD